MCKGRHKNRAAPDTRRYEDFGMQIIRLLAIYVVLCGFVNAETNEVTYEWFRQNHNEVIEVLRDTTKNADQVINNILMVFRNRDGAIGIEISYYIEQALLHRPKDMINGFYNSPQEYKDWLNQVGTYLLTDFSGKRIEEKEKLKRDVLKVLESFIESNPEPEYRKIAQELLLEIQSTPVTAVE